MIKGTIKLDDIELITRKTDSMSQGVTEIRNVKKLKVFEKRRVAYYELAASNHTISNDLGRCPTCIIIAGDLAGKNAKDTVKSLRSKYRSGDSLTFSSEIEALSHIRRVIATELFIEIVSSLPMCYSYLISLVEDVVPEESKSGPTASNTIESLALEVFEAEVKAAAKELLS